MIDLSTISGSSLDIQTLLLKSSNGIISRNNGNNVVNEIPEYAKKGEPMYMPEMDTDEDNIVSLDEFKEYCKSNGISTKQMIKMSQYAASYRTMKAECEAIDYISKLIPNVHPNLKESSSESGNLKDNENQYNIFSDTNETVPYDKYMEYCEQNVVPQELKANTRVEETDNGNLEIINFGKAIESYKNSESYSVLNTFEEVV